MAKAKVESGPTALDPEVADVQPEVNAAPEDQVVEQPQVPLDPLMVAASAANAAKQVARTSEAAVIEAERIFDGLLPAATSTALDARVHSVEEIERGYTLAMEARAQRDAARQTLIVAWTAQDQAESSLIELEHAALLEARRIDALSRPTA